MTCLINIRLLTEKMLKLIVYVSRYPYILGVVGSTVRELEKPGIERAR